MTEPNNWRCMCGAWNGQAAEVCRVCRAPNETGFAYVVVMKDTIGEDRLRADFKVHDHYSEAQLRQAELGRLNGQPSWIMSFPDPRAVAND